MQGLPQGCDIRKDLTFCPVTWKTSAYICSVSIILCFYSRLIVLQKVCLIKFSATEISLKNPFHVQRRFEVRQDGLDNVILTRFFIRFK